MHLARMVEKKIESLDSVQKERKFLRSQNTSLSQKLKECAFVSLGLVIESFKNALQQVEHFHYPLVVSREPIRPGQVLLDGKIIYILE